MSFLILLMNRYFLDGYSWLIICSVYSLGLFILFMWVGLFSIISYTFWGMIWFGYLVSDLAFRWSCKLFLIFPCFFPMIRFHISFLVFFLCTELFCFISSIYAFSVPSCSSDPSLCQCSVKFQTSPTLGLSSKSNPIGSCHSPAISLAIFFILLESPHSSLDPDK